MAYEFQAFDSTLASAAGDDAVLYAELRAAFITSLERQLDLLRRARCDGNWRMAALRLKALGASFQTSELMQLADEALDAAPGDPMVVRRIRQFLVEVAAR